MKKRILIIYQFLLCLIIIDFFLITKSSGAFFPKINEPTQKELQSTAIQLARTAIQLIEFGQNENAIKFLELAVKLNPYENDLWLSLAEVQIRSNKKYQALSSLKKAIELKPKEQSIYFTKASLYMDLNKPKEAKSYIKKGLSINNNNDRGYFQLGNAEIMLNNYKSAIIAFKKSTKINPNFWQSINNEGLILYELDNRKQALSKFKLALKISNNAEPMLALAIVLFSTNNKPIEAINLAKNALKANPQYISKEYQTKQLWGKKLQKSAELLFKSKEMIRVVKEAKEKSQ
tara:strand:- start:14 stop:883 length:870 start_codon:yes stop_codon:yes gene_type:complete